MISNSGTSTLGLYDFKRRLDEFGGVLPSVLPITKGGTGAATTEAARSNLGAAGLGSENKYTTTQFVGNEITGCSFQIDGTQYNRLADFIDGWAWGLFRKKINNESELTLLFTANGDITNMNNSYGALSDKRFKENIEAASSQWNDIKALNFVNYNLINDGKRQIGLIAQEVQQVSPYLVEEQHNEETDEKFLTLKYSVLNIKVAKAVQELILRVEALEQKLVQYEAGQ